MILFSATVSCLKDDGRNHDPRFISVDQYISLLKSGNFNVSREMPIFEISDIPKLLKYARNETRILVDVTNSFSSILLVKLDTTIGMMALWSIEDTRLDEHPSISPVVMDSNGQNVAQTVVAGLYESWWEKNKGKSLAQLMEISPFAGTDYRWH